MLEVTKNTCVTSKAKLRKTEKSLKLDEDDLEKLKKKVKDAEDLIGKKRRYVEYAKWKYEKDKKDLSNREKEKNVVLKRFKQLSYEYHPVATKLFLDEQVESKGKSVSLYLGYRLF